MIKREKKTYLEWEKRKEHIEKIRDHTDVLVYSSVFMHPEKVKSIIFYKNPL